MNLSTNIINELFLGKYCDMVCECRNPYYVHWCNYLLNLFIKHFLQQY